MRPTPRLTSVLVLTVLALLVSGCYGVATIVRQAPSPMMVPPGAPRHAGAVPRLPNGVQISTDPMPHPVRVYRTPEWDPETTVLVGEVTRVVIAPLAVWWSHLSGRPVANGPSNSWFPQSFADLPPREWSGPTGARYASPVVASANFSGDFAISLRNSTSTASFGPGVTGLPIPRTRLR